MTTHPRLTVGDLPVRAGDVPMQRPRVNRRRKNIRRNALRPSPGSGHAYCALQALGKPGARRSDAGARGSVEPL
jgi:hypothetical protein